MHSRLFHAKSAVYLISVHTLKALAAFANSQGGTLRVSVKDNGAILGWNGDGKEQEGISRKIVSVLHVHPASMRIENLQEKPVLAIAMLSAAAPVALRGRYFRRVGNSSREVPQEELPRFLLERTGQSWDAIAADYSLESIDAETLAQFRLFAKERLPQFSATDIAQRVLTKLRLIQNERMKRAAVLLFGNATDEMAPSAQVQIGRFRDADIILDDRRISGNLIQQLEQIEQTLRQYFLIRYEFPTGQETTTGAAAFQREEIWQYPYKAIREAVLNALIHRDYSSSGRIQIRVYDDRVIISNPGGLPAGLTVHDLFQDPHDSLPRNPIVAQVCYYAQFVEQWGSGTLRMRTACRAAGLPDPEFQSTETSFSVTMRQDELSDDRLRQMGMNERQVKAVHIVRQQGSISNSEYQELHGVIRRTAGRDLKELVEKNVLHTPNRTGPYVRYSLVTIQPTFGLETFAPSGA